MAQTTQDGRQTAGKDGAGMKDAIDDWIGRMVGPERVSGWVMVDQAMVSEFADVTRDRNFLHVDEAAARGAGMTRTIAHGFLTLSLLSPMRMEAGLEPCPGLKVAMNYGMDAVRFLAPVYTGDRIRGRFTTTAVVETQPGRYRETLQASVEIEGQEKPALVATWIAIYMT